jgi:hypothetical protein
LFCFGNDIVGGCDGFLRLHFLDFGGGGTGLLDGLGRLHAGLIQYFLRLGLGIGQFLLDLLGIGEALGDLLAPLFQDGENRLVGEPMQQKRHQAEADHL